MAASDYQYVLTRNELIEEAYKKLGVVTDGDPMTGEQITTGVRRLNLIVQEWEADGVHLWRTATDTQQLSVGKSSYSFPSNPPPHAIDRCILRRRNGDNTYSDTPLEFVSFHEFQNIYNKQAEGRPILYTIDIRNEEIIPWPVPSERDSLLIFYIAALKDMEDADTPPGDFPRKWHRALLYALAVDLSDDYPVSASKLKQLKDAFSESYLKARGSERQNGDNDFVGNAYDNT